MPISRNSQGDVVGIFNSGGGKVGSYTYDSWGKVVSATPTSSTSDPNGILQKNPFRYRGYYYDQETSWYYLQSRHYNPEVKRFLNADWQFNLEDGPSGLNLFAYCNNNPVNNHDPSGQATEVIVQTLDWLLIRLMEVLAGYFLMLGIRDAAQNGLFDVPVYQPAPYYGQNPRAQYARNNKNPPAPPVVSKPAINVSTPASPEPPKDDKPSLKPLSKRFIKEWTKDNGFSSVENFKEQFVRRHPSEFNVKVNTKTGELWLEGVENGVQIPTGFFKYRRVI